jgi:hypothetical protein
VLNHLSLSENASSGEIKSTLESKLSKVLPHGSFTVILRSYQGDVRARNSNQGSYKAIILLDPAGRNAALSQKEEIEALGFQVSSSGDISLN